jgi:hypothetical protein
VPFCARGSGCRPRSNQKPSQAKLRRNETSDSNREAGTYAFPVAADEELPGSHGPSCARRSSGDGDSGVWFGVGACVRRTDSRRGGYIEGGGEQQVAVAGLLAAEERKKLWALRRFLAGRCCGRLWVRAEAAEPISQPGLEHAQPGFRLEPHGPCDQRLESKRQAPPFYRVAHKSIQRIRV